MPARRPRSTSCGCTPASCSRSTRSSAASSRAASPSTRRPCARRGTRPSSAVLAEATLRARAELDADRRPAGRHSEHLGFMLAELQFLQRAYPGSDMVSAAPAPTRLAIGERPRPKRGEELRARAWAAAASVVDPELPVLTIDDLGILRDVAIADDGTVEVAITPTYSGCPAMDGHRARGRVRARARRHRRCAGADGALAGLDHRLDVRRTAARKLQGLRHRAAGRRRRRGARCSASRRVACPHCGSADTEQARRVRLDRLQGAVAMHELPRAVRPFQVHLIR